MHNRLKQSTAIKRQIPEYIRDNYPLFVEFLKSYYEFLDQTQNQNLEEFRNIDTTLESFIERFKSELATNVPIELAQDKRMLLKHLREFYLSRGSEASFKFLFRTLFNREATLFYPSTQVLRVSDGKWNQDTTIFVRMTSETTSLFPLDGNFINIQSGDKNIQSYIKSVLQYSGDIYELFIDRNIANQIVVSSEISATIGNVLYEGVVVKCPSRISIYKKGKGFSPGDVFSLKSNIGNGCLVKVTKTDSEGGILAIQVIRFALDYESTFWSYLSSKEIEGIEFIHPLTLNWAGPGNPPPYNENHGGFIEYGFATKQTYMSYDSDIPVGSPDRASDRYYVEPSYVGDIVSSFYNEQREKVIDEDIAIIQIELGAVAKYPGYYLSQDGFISDEMYIHDGKYYQAFSYVIKVEEELRRYADLVKSILHPAGMRMFAEYDILNQLDIAFSSPFSFNSLQFSDSLENIIDGGFSYSDYSAELDAEGNLIIPVTPAPGAFPILAETGRASKVVIKNFLTDFVTQAITRVNHFFKNLSDNQVQIDDVAKHFFKNTNSNLTSPQSLITAKLVSKSLTDSLLSPNSQVAKSFSKSLTDEVDQLISIVEKLFNKNLTDNILSPLSSRTNLFEKNLTEQVPQTSAISNFAYSKGLTESILNSSTISIKSLEKALADGVSSSEIIEVLRSTLFEDTLTVGSLIQNFLISKGFTEAVLNSSVPAKGFERGFADNNVSTSDSSVTNPNLIKSETITLLSAIQNFAISKALTEVVNIVEAISNNLNKNLSSSVSSPTDTISRQPNLGKSDTQSLIMAGSMYKNAYNEENYFETLSNYEEPVATLT